MSTHPTPAQLPHNVYRVTVEVEAPDKQSVDELTSHLRRAANSLFSSSQFSNAKDAARFMFIWL